MLIQRKIEKVMTWVGGVEKQIRPSGWTPGENTVAYYPLKSDVLDYSGKGNHASGNPNSFTGGVANYTSSAGYTIIPYSLINTTTGTVNVWVYWDGTANVPFLTQHTSSVRGFTFWFDSSRNAKFGWESDISKSSPTANSWQLFTGLWNGSTYTFYYNGVYVGSLSSRTQRTTTLYLGYDGYTGHKANWKISNVIIENKKRTAQEISDYYNLTKSNYGL